MTISFLPHIFRKKYFASKLFVFRETCGFQSVQKIWSTIFSNTGSHLNIKFSKHLWRSKVRRSESFRSKDYQLTLKVISRHPIKHMRNREHVQDYTSTSVLQNDWFSVQRMQLSFRVNFKWTDIIKKIVSYKIYNAIQLLSAYFTMAAMCSVVRYGVVQYI